MVEDWGAEARLQDHLCFSACWVLRFSRLLFSPPEWAQAAAPRPKRNRKPVGYGFPGTPAEEVGWLATGRGAPVPGRRQVGGQAGLGGSTRGRHALVESVCASAPGAPG